MKDKLREYVEFLRNLDIRLKQYFEEQKEHLKCRTGCSYCCENGNYPLSWIEYEYLKIGIGQLERVQIKLILHKAIQIAGNGEKLYKCPLLKDNLCQAYAYRPLICRTHGLLVKNIKDGKETYELPACMGIGLNYADVWDNEKKLFSKEKIQELQIKIPPRIYDIGYFILLKELEKTGHGEVKMLYEWLLMEE